MQNARSQKRFEIIIQLYIFISQVSREIHRISYIKTLFHLFIFKFVCADRFEARKIIRTSTRLNKKIFKNLKKKKTKSRERETICMIFW